MPLNIYGIAFILSFIMLILLVLIGKRQNITYYLLVFMAILLSCMGHYMLSISTELEAAIVGHRFVYLGGAENLRK